MKDYIKTMISESVAKWLQDLNLKKNKKSKDTLKLVKKIDEEHIDNLTELVNKIFISRHKLRMIYFLMSREADKEDE
jgi:hypothetical protein